MAKSQNVVVYLRADDVRFLEAEGKDPPLWVRGLVRHAIDRMKEQNERVRQPVAE